MATLRPLSAVLATPSTTSQFIRHVSTKTAKSKPVKQPKPQTKPTSRNPTGTTSTTPTIDPATLSSVSYLPTPSNNPEQSALAAPIPPVASLKSTTALFTSRKPHFLYSAARFLHLPQNSHTPEVCLLGRSNVGKSTLINALAGAEGATARASHGLRARGAGLAITSRRAGSTQCMNGYGFGVPCKEQYLSFAQAAQEAPKRAKSRSERRKEHKEEPPRHRLVMVDMPGYGLGSQEAWGVEIQKYLARRAMLRGAVLLVDAVAGIKEADKMVLGMLRDAEVRTAVVLTKADKLGGGEDGRKERVDEVCLSVWEELRRVEQESLTWLEGAERGWESEIWVTGAGDPESGGLGVAGARWAICRIAGIVKDERVFDVPGVVQKPSAPRIVSFDELMWKAPAQQRPSF